MNANGKRARKETGLNRYEHTHANHTRKSAAKIARAGWTRNKSESTNARHAAK